MIPDSNSVHNIVQVWLYHKQYKGVCKNATNLENQLTQSICQITLNLQIAQKLATCNFQEMSLAKYMVQKIYREWQGQVTNTTKYLDTVIN